MKTKPSLTVQKGIKSNKNKMHQSMTVQYNIDKKHVNITALVPLQSEVIFTILHDHVCLKMPAIMIIIWYGKLKMFC